MSLLVQFLRLMWRSARWQLVASVALSTLLSLSEGVSLAMVFPVIALLGASPADPAATSAGPRTRLLFHLLTLAHIPRSAWLGAILVVVLLSVGLLTLLNGMLVTLATSIVLPVRRNLAAEVYHAILHADWAFLVRRRSSDLTHFLTSEMARIATLAASILGLVSNCMVGVLMLALAAWLAPLLTLLLVVCLALLLPWQRRSGRAIYRSGTGTGLKMGQVFESSIERLQNLKVVKAYGAQDAELALFTRRYSELIDELLANQWRNVRSSRQFQMLSLLLLCLLILLGLNTLHLAPAAMLIFLFAIIRAMPRLNAVQARVNEILTELPAYAQTVAFLAECREHAESGDSPSQSAAESAIASAPTLHRELILSSLSFRYSSATPLILDQVSLTLPAGSITALAGLSGAGKSTIADLVMGLLTPHGGSVLADGTPITRSNARAWRRRIGYVSQDALLFHDSIRANLLWALPSATEAQLHQAIEAASAGFVHTLAHGLDTVVGDRGIMLSHGQRQRIALARALLLQPSLLILDEATNSLDLENEENILRIVRELGTASDPVTTLLISHRPSAVRIADRVYVLDAAKVSLSPKP